jgi:hypothetical protein
MKDYVICGGLDVIRVISLKAGARAGLNAEIVLQQSFDFFLFFQMTRFLLLNLETLPKCCIMSQRQHYA